MVVGHAERVPGVPVHRLQSPRLFQRLGCFLMLAERAKSQPHAVPGAVERGLEPDRLAKGLDRLFLASRLVADEAEVEIDIGIGLEPQAEQEIILRLVVLVARSMQIAQAQSGLGKSRIVLERQPVFLDCATRLLECLKRQTAQIMAPLLEIHGISLRWGKCILPVCPRHCNRSMRQGRYQLEFGAMIQFEILLISILRTLVEVAGLALLGQGLLAVLAGSKRDANFVYRLFQVVTARSSS